MQVNTLSGCTHTDTPWSVLKRSKKNKSGCGKQPKRTKSDGLKCKEQTSIEKGRGQTRQRRKTAKNMGSSKWMWRDRSRRLKVRKRSLRTVKLSDWHSMGVQLALPRQPGGKLYREENETSYTNIVTTRLITIIIITVAQS